MPLCPEVPDHLIVCSISESQPCRPLMVAGYLLLAVMLAGCTAIAPSGRQQVQSTPAVASAPPSPPVENWSSQTRRGREALLEREFQTAEILLLSALDASHSFRSRDVRVDVSFGNLIRLASVYERLGRQDDAKRVLAAIESSAGRRRMAASYRISAQGSNAHRAGTGTACGGGVVETAHFPHTPCIGGNGFVS